MIQRSIFRGDTIVIDFQVVQPPPVPGTAIIPTTAAMAADRGTTGLIPANITGWFIWCTVKNFYPDPDTIAVGQASSTPASTPPGGGVALTTPTDGLGEATIPPAATQLFPDSPVTLVYDIKVRTTDSPAREFTIETGQIVVSPNVTRAN